MGEEIKSPSSFFFEKALAFSSAVRYDNRRFLFCFHTPQHVVVCESRKLRIPEKLRGRKCSGKCAAGIRKTMNHRRGVNSSMIQTIMKRNGEIV